MRIPFFIVLFLSSWTIFAQNNNVLHVDFSAGTAGWSATGSGVLSHQPDGFLSPGAVQVQVASSGNFPDAQLKSPAIEIPQEHWGKMHFLAFAGKATSAGSALKVRVDYFMASGETNTTVFEERKPGDSFEQYGIPVYLPEGTQSIVVRMMCGFQSGKYIFDDIQLFLSVTPPQTIARFSHWQPREWKAPEIPPLPGTMTPAAGGIQIDINPDSVIAPVASVQFGVNSNFRSGNDLLERTGTYTPFGSFRFPAGSGSNEYFWDCDPPSAFSIPLNGFCADNAQYLSPDHFISFKNSVNGEVTIVVNYMLARYGVTTEGTRQARVRQAAQYAAAWVHYFNVELQGAVKYWEIGNECYGPWETGYDVNGAIITGKEYGEDFNVFVEEMKAVDPDIKCGAVLWHKGDSWNESVIKAVKLHADFFIVHHYFEPTDAATSREALLEIQNDMQQIQAAAAFFSGKPPGYFPVAFTEFNIQGPQTTTMLNGMFVAEALTSMIENGFFMSNIWVNEWNIDADNHSKGILAQNDSRQADYTPRPSFTPFYYLHRYFGDEMVHTTVTGSNEVRAYASAFSNEAIGAVVVNYSGTSQSISLNVGGDFTPDSVYWHTVSSDNLTPGNTRFWVNGLTSATVGGGPALEDVAPLAAAWTPGGSVAIPPFSATYLALTTASTSTASVAPIHRNLKLSPNPAAQTVYIQPDERASSETIQIRNAQGQPVYATVLHTDEYGLQLDCSALPAGIYFVRINGQSARLVKM